MLAMQSRLTFVSAHLVGLGEKQALCDQKIAMAKLWLLCGKGTTTVLSSAVVYCVSLNNSFITELISVKTINNPHKRSVMFILDCMFRVHASSLIGFPGNKVRGWQGYLAFAWLLHVLSLRAFWKRNWFVLFSGLQLKKFAFPGFHSKPNTGREELHSALIFTLPPQSNQWVYNGRSQWIIWPRHLNF